MAARQAGRAGADRQGGGRCRGKDAGQAENSGGRIAATADAGVRRAAEAETAGDRQGSTEAERVRPEGGGQTTDGRADKGVGEETLGSLAEAVRSAGDAAKADAQGKHPRHVGREVGDSQG